MKKIAPLLIALAGFEKTNSQVLQGIRSVKSGEGDFRFGAKAGMHFSTFTGSTHPDTTPQLGAFVGGSLEIPAYGRFLPVT